MNAQRDRRLILAAGGALLLSACERKRSNPTPGASAEIKAARPVPAASGGEAAAEPEKAEAEVTATEDLMREHGVIRRVLVVYRDTAARLRVKPGDVPLASLRQAAQLIRTFAEDYHEKQLEEQHVFPALVDDGALKGAVGTLIDQHQRGRAITDYVLALTTKPVHADNAEILARTLEAFARMYEEHAAYEDTVVFPRWKQQLSPAQRKDMGERFEEIEHKAFGKDGFEEALSTVGGIEKAFGISLGSVTPPPPPR